MLDNLIILSNNYLKMEDKRSLQLNKYYWGLVIPESSKALIYAGWERERFNHFELVHKFWKNILNTPSTADLNNRQFKEYIEDIKRICAMYLLHVIPDPPSEIE